MTTPLTDADLVHLGVYLRRRTAIDISMLDGYLAAVASGPNLFMPDQMLGWVCDCGNGGAETHKFVNLILRHFQAVNDALNDGIYTPRFIDPHAWCRGYLIGFSADMTAWEPLLSVQPELLKVILSFDNRPDPLSPDAAADLLADSAGRIHEFWVDRRRRGRNLDDEDGIEPSRKTGTVPRVELWLH